MNSKDLFESDLHQLYDFFLSTIKQFGYKIGTQFNNTPLFIEQNNYAVEIGNAYIVYNLNHWVNNPLRCFTLKIAFLVQLL